MLSWPAQHWDPKLVYHDDQDAKKRSNHHPVKYSGKDEAKQNTAHTSGTSPVSLISCASPAPANKDPEKFVGLHVDWPPKYHHHKEEASTARHCVHRIMGLMAHEFEVSYGTWARGSQYSNKFGKYAYFPLGTCPNSISQAFKISEISISMVGGTEI